MHRLIFLLGVALLVGSLVMLLVSSSMLTVKLVPLRKGDKGEFNSWEISRELEEGNSYVVDVFSSDNWTEPFAQGFYEEPQPVDMVIIPPDGGEIKLKAFFYGEPSRSPYYSYYFRPKIVSVQYVSINSDSIKVDKNYSPIRFTVKQGGEYTVHIINDTLYWTEGPPKLIKIEKEVVEVQDLYPIFSHGGLVLLIAGIAVSVVGIKTKARKKVSLRKRKVHGSEKSFSKNLKYIY